MARICMVGTGYVGLVSGACFADFGHQVDCIDIDAERIATLERGEIPFYEPGLATLVEKNRKTGRLNFGTNLGPAVELAEVIMIAVQTPPRENGEADLRYVMQAGEDVAKLLRPGQYKVICTKSTVPVGTARNLERTVRQHAVSGVEFDVASNPEFLREGSSIEDFMRPDRVVIGTRSERAEQIMRDLYRPLYLMDTPIVATTLETSELIKYAANAFLAVKISYVNEVSNLCEELNADVKIVARAMGLDRRIGPKFLHAGLGFGGSCLPKDTRAIAHMGEGTGQQFRLVEAAIAVNQERVDRAIAKLESLLGSLEGRTVALLGLAFKPNTDDIREAPSLRIVERLHARGAKLRGCDPEAGQRFLAEWPALELSPDPYLCVEGADACLLVTEWNPYRELDLPRMRASMKGDVFIDCRNVYDRERVEQAGFRYDCFGR